MDEILKDSRFAHIVKDPRFRRIPKRERKVKIDKRFRSMFKDKRFKVKYTIDKRGRPTNTSSAEDLKRYYDISSGDEESDSESDEEGVESKGKLLKIKQKKKRNAENGTKERAELNKSSKDESDSSIEQQEDSDGFGDEQSGSESDKEGVESKGKLLKIKQKKKRNAENGTKERAELNKSSKDESDSNIEQQEDSDGFSDEGENDELSEDVNLSDKIKDKLHDMTVDYARGEGVLLSDSSSDDDSDSEGASADSEDVEHDWGELDKDADTTQEASRRIAVCNMDWDRVRAQDLLVLLSSFLPKTGGAVEKVTIYPSEFGLQRMKEEEVKGPIELCEDKKANSDEEGSTVEDKEEDETEEGRRYHMEKLRRYQLNRLKYFYAIAECDSVATAEHIYNECDGLEYESSATKLDLRFVPDDMTFDQEPRDSCDSLPEPGKYAPKLFTNTALQQAKVELTWDETDPQRVDIARKLQTVKNIDEIDDADLRAYLASSGSDEEEPDEEHKEEEDELSSDAEGQSKNGDVLSRYKLLLEEAERQEAAKKKRAEDVQMEVTWGLGLKERTEQLVKQRLKAGAGQATPFEEMLAKRREKRRQRREERKRLNQQGRQEEDGDAAPFSDDEIPSDIDMSDPYFKEELKDMVPKESKKKKRKRQDADDDEDEEEKRRKAELELLMLEDGGQESKKHFSLKSIQEAESSSKKKRKKKKLGKKAKKEEQATNAEDDFQVNINDERFSALFSSHHYNIDPTDPHYRQTKGMEALRKAKLERRHREDDGEEVKLHQSSSKEKDTTLSQLVKSVKMKTRGLVK